MKWFFIAKDGGPESKVTGYWLVEAKDGISIALLKFDYGSREAFHTHAFDAISWVLYGALKEYLKFSSIINIYRASIVPIITKKSTYHKVEGLNQKGTWVFSITGPWNDKWKEYLPLQKRELTLTHGRQEILT